MSAMSFLVKYGVAVPAYNVVSWALIPRIVREQTLVREHSLAGISYDETVKVQIFARIYLNGEALTVLRDLGIEIQQNPLPLLVADEEEEEAKPIKGKKRAVRVVEEEQIDTRINENPSFIEYVMTENSIIGDRFPLVNHPKFLKLLANPENKERITNRLNNYHEAVSNMSATLAYEPDMEIEDEDTAFTSRLSGGAMQAQAEAYRREQETTRKFLDATLNLFDDKVIKAAGFSEENIYLEELFAKYGKQLDEDGLPMFEIGRLLEDISREIISVDLGSND